MFRSYNDFTYAQEIQIAKQLENIKFRRAQQRLTANEQIAQIAGDIVKMAPTAQPHLVLPIAKAVASGALTRDAADNLVMNVQKKVLTNPVTFTFDKKGGGIFDWVDDAWDATYGAAKRGLNWTKNGIFSNLASSIEYTKEYAIDPAYTVFKGAAKPVIAQGYSVLEGAQNVMSAAVQSMMQQPSTTPINTGMAKPNVLQYPDTEGFGYVPPEDPMDMYKQWRSTSFGAYLSGGYKGNGFFINEEARKKQVEYQREVRGTVAGHAVTLGRGLALSFAEPDTPIYNIVSGSIDAYIALKIPTAPGSKPLTNIIKKGLSDIDIGRLVAEGDESVPLLRSLVGLNGTGTQINRAKLPEFLDSVVGRWVMNEAANANTIEDARKLFPNADVWWWQKIKESNPDTVRQIFEENLGLQRGLTSTGQINVSRWSDVKTAMLRSDTAVWSGAERLFGGTRPGEGLVVFSDNVRDYTIGVNNLIEYMKTLRIPFEERTALIDEFADVVTNSPEKFREVAKKIKTTVDAAIIDRSRLGRIAPGVGGKVRIDEEGIADLWKQPEELKDGWETWGAQGEDGMPTIFGLKPTSKNKKASMRSSLEATTIDGTPATVLIPDNWAMLVSEGRRVGLVLPDPNRVYRATSPFNFMFETNSIFVRNPQKFGNPRTLTVLADFIQNDVWKRFVLMTFANTLRNTTESMARTMFEPGLRLGPTHPLNHIATAIHGDLGKFMGDVEGNFWADAATAGYANVRNEYMEALETHLQKTVGSEQLQKLSAQTGSWGRANKNMGQTYIQGLADQIHLLANDPLAQKVAAGWVIGDAKTPGTIIHWLSTTEEGKNYLRRMQGLHSNKLAYNLDTKEWERVNIEYVDKAGNPNVNNIEKHVELYIRDRIAAETANHPELKNIIATGNRMGEFTYNGESVTAFTTYKLGRNGEEVVLDYNPKFLKLIAEAVDDPNYTFPTNVKFRQYLDPRGAGAQSNPWTRARDRAVTRYFGDLLGKSEQELNRSPAFRQFYHNYLDPLVDELAPGEAKIIYNNIKYAHQKVWEEKLSNLKRLHKNADGTYAYNGKAITAAERKKLIAEATEELKYRRARFEEKQFLTGWLWPEQYLGSKELWQKIVDQAEGRLAATGTLTAAQASTAAKVYALEATKNLFYDASRRNNMWEVLRIIYPFGKAWKDSARRWTRTLSEVENLQRAAIKYQGIKSADPDADGRGFIYTDPITGEQMFNYPMGTWSLPILAALTAGTVGAMVLPFSTGASFAAGAAAGLGGGLYGREKLKGTQYELAAPVKSLNMALNVWPGHSPLVQMAVDKLLPDKPKYDDVRKFISPYGTPAGPTEVMKAIPWLDKLAGAIENDPENDTTFMGLYFDAFATLLATGKYDRNNPNDMDRLDKEARAMGRWLTIAQSVGQMVGPSRPKPVLYTPTKFEGELTVADIEMVITDGNIPNNVLARVFREMQNDDYENAVPNFLDAFNWNADMFVNGKSYAVTEGLRADKTFGDWERNNAGVVERHKNIYGYFADVGTEFDLQTYLRQIETGSRERWDNPLAKLEDAESVVGKALYRQALRQLGPEITESERGALNSYRLYLEETYPGYAMRVTDTNVLERKIRWLRDAANDNELRDNPVAIATRAYLEARDDVMDIAQNRREQPVVDNILQGKKNQDLRQKLRQFGDFLVTEYPEFARVYDELLLYEIDEE